MGIRTDKVASLIKEEISLIFLHKIQDGRIGLVTVTNVKVSPDLKQAKIYLSTFDKENRKTTMDRIEKIKGMIRSELAKRIKLRFVPELFFYVDDTPDYVEKMENLFKQIHENDSKESE
ncbi:MAG: 30S ribosome-binding factor RbfA [Bacteroidetes bacterium]|nr:30S ribosome-binding factor RbfA [Bacteroidota bacterium]